MIGFFGYDLAPRLERLPRRHPRDSRLPDIRMALYDTAVIVDARSGTVELWSWDLTGEGRSAAEKRCRAWRESIERAIDSPRPARIRPSTFENLTSSFNRETYLASVDRVLDYIAAGDVFQVNLSQRFIATGRPEPLDLYLRLKAASPAPFAAFLQWDDLAVVVGEPGVVLPDARRRSGHAADQGNAAARPRRPTTMSGSPPSCAIRPKTAPSSR